jgi:hypothetical protein
MTMDEGDAQTGGEEAAAGGAAAQLPPRQPPRGAGRGRLRADRGEGSARLHGGRGGARGRASARPRPTGTSRAATISSRRWRCAASRCSPSGSSARPRAARRAARRLLGGRRGLSRFRAHASGLLHGDVRVGRLDRRRPELKRAADRAMGVLRLSAERLSAHLPPGRRPPAGMVANHIWAFSHGVVELFARGRPGTRALLGRGDAGERHDDLSPRARPHPLKTARAST